MPLNTNRSGSMSPDLFKLELSSKSPVQDLQHSKEGVVALTGSDLNPNLLRGFIPPGELVAG